MVLLRKIIFLLLFMLVLSVAYAQTEAVKGKEPAEPGYVTGRMESANKALVSGYIGFFVTSGRMPDPTRFWRTPDYVYSLDKDGKFNAQLPEGNYYVIAIKKSEKELGPPEAGDQFFYFMDSKGPMIVGIKKGAKIDLGTRQSIPVTFVSEKEGITVIKGVILNEEGKPLSGVFIGAYEKPVMLGRPNYISYKSDKDGRYELRLPEGGSYYITARSRLGGPPVKGEFYGRVGDEKNPVSIKTGEMSEINIKVFKVR